MGSDNRSEATTTELTLAQSTHADSKYIDMLQQLLQEVIALRIEMTTRNQIGTVRSELATKSEIGTFRSEMATKIEIGTIRREVATMEQPMTIGTRRELDVLMSRQTQETLEQLQQHRDERTTTFNQTVSHMNEKLEDKIKVVDCQLSQVKPSVSTHATSMETIKTTLDVQVKQSSDQKQKSESQMNETNIQTAIVKSQSNKFQNSCSFSYVPSIESRSRKILL